MAELESSGKMLQSAKKSWIGSKVSTTAGNRRKNVIWGQMTRITSIDPKLKGTVRQVMP